MHARARIGAEDIATYAWILYDRHGAGALREADRIIAEFEEEGDAFSAACWRILRSMVDDAMAGRMARGALTLH